MKKASYLVLALLLAVPSFAGMNVPVDQSGAPVIDARLAGADTCMIANSTGTSAVLCATGAGTILGVIQSSTAVTDYLTFRDSATANTTSTELARIEAGTAVNGALLNNGVFPRFKNGLSVNASVAPVGTTGAWFILYRSNKS